ncbi:XRE family transcriptional regulator [Sphingopyxis terrae]|uniref:XRE family transcriptional regulator n=1 Tax=Sphingopyxis terrae TaxID=33052 RepID=UPI0013C47215|nr:XRE family transcriptional regulator [Sphingopyxis terrae]
MATDQEWDLVPLIVNAMAEKNAGQRKLAVQSQISKSRLGLLLHSDPAKRATMSVPELRRILVALGIPLMQVAIAVDAPLVGPLFHDERFANSISMLIDAFKELPSMLVTALDEIEGLDGTEVRKEWAGPLRQAVVEKLIKEVTAVMARRDVLSQISSIGL